MSKIEDMKESYRQEKAQKKQSNGLNQGLNEKEKELRKTFEELSEKSYKIAVSMTGLTEETRETLELIRDETGELGKELKEMIQLFKKEQEELKKENRNLISESLRASQTVGVESTKRLRSWKWKTWVIMILVSIAIGITSASGIYLLHWKPKVDKMMKNQDYLYGYMKKIHDAIFKPDSGKK